tara:strand:- start:207 stop:401 length:195 start_codon:yes stop_codon:yes gene_type:complete
MIKLNFVKKVKSKLLTKLFVEWVGESKDIEALQFSKELIDSRIDKVDNRTRIIGFHSGAVTPIA